MKAWQSTLARIALILGGDGTAELSISDRKHPNRRPVKKHYAWDEKPLWERDLYTLLGATGAREVDSEED